jgi:uncharacterized protein YijF (DUF1287 family)
MKKRLVLLIGIVVLFFACASNSIKDLVDIYLNNFQDTNNQSAIIDHDIKIKYFKVHPLVESAREQIGVVTKYDSSYYEEGYPPSDRGACTDLVERALRENNYMLKDLLDKDMANNSNLYPQEFDSNINFRRVRNVKIFLDRHAEKLSVCVSSNCFEQNIWQAGDIVTYEQIPGSLWHIAIISNKAKIKDQIAIPYLIHNYGYGVVEDDKLLSWPAPISGHYRIFGTF